MKLKEAAKPQIVSAVKTIEGTGSVWNTGSYHWEEKSVNKWAEETLRATLGCFKYTWNDATLAVTEVKELKGESGVSIRKGKKIVSYDYSITLSWRVSMSSMVGGGPEVAFCTGLFELPEVSNDEDDWEVRVAITEDKENLKEVLKQFIRTMSVKELRA